MRRLYALHDLLKRPMLNRSVVGRILNSADFSSLASIPDTEVEQSGVVPANKTLDGDIENPQDAVKSEEPLTTPQSGRLPARASRS